MREMFLGRRRRDKDVVDIRVTKLEIAQNLVNKTLACLSRLLQAERHKWKFEHPKCRYRGFRDIPFRHRDLVICPHQIDDGKFLSLKSLRKILDISPDSNPESYARSTSSNLRRVAIPRSSFAPCAKAPTNSSSRIAQYRLAPFPQISSRPPNAPARVFAACTSQAVPVLSLYNDVSCFTSPKYPTDLVMSGYHASSL